MNKIHLLIAAFFILLIGCNPVNQKKETVTKPNILWIVCDDLGTDLGCYGTPLIQTPILDEFAGQSIRFENCHTVTAVCSSSRSSMVTGMYPVSINCHQHRTRPESMLPLPDSVKVITEYFEEAGYFTFNNRFGSKDKSGKTDYNFTTDYEIYDGTHWSQRQEEQPFFGQVQIHFPHRPFTQDTINPIDESKVELPPYLPDHWVARQDWAFYLETIQVVDQEIGQLLAALEQDGLMDNTYIFIVGDQGRPMVRNKQFLYDGGTNTPLLIRYPNNQFAGEVRDELVSNIDLSATSLKLAGIEVPEHIRGNNILGEHTPRAELYTMRDRRDETVDRIRAIRTKKYKYIRNFYTDRPYTQYNAYKRNKYPTLVLMEVLKSQDKLRPEQLSFMSDFRPAEELYDLENDPYELNNLAASEDNIQIKKELGFKLDEWLKHEDVATYPEDGKEIEYWTKQMAKRDKVWKRKRNLPVDVSDEDYLAWWEKHLKSRQVKK
ncbi:sulfatase family protein [Marinilabilia rubra]|uniref:Arylsulfatase n=1 Tax=Marinilabilia rubra TaxID=2162893 RepID=A0A2U2BB74_9BACT|nr:sulfatase [Marinilabilia rubra]PWE00309.1 arylsulfatase [Marinilabilia rubra]